VLAGWRRGMTSAGREGEGSRKEEESCMTTDLIAGRLT
jgi:hypothetical protein